MSWAASRVWYSARSSTPSARISLASALAASACRPGRSPRQADPPAGLYAERRDELGDPLGSEVGHWETLSVDPSPAWTASRRQALAAGGQRHSGIRPLWRCGCILQKGGERPARGRHRTARRQGAPPGAPPGGMLRPTRSRRSSRRPEIGPEDDPAGVWRVGACRPGDRRISVADGDRGPRPDGRGPHRAAATPVAPGWLLASVEGVLLVALILGGPGQSTARDRGSAGPRSRSSSSSWPHLGSTALLVYDLVTSSPLTSGRTRCCSPARRCGSATTSPSRSSTGSTTAAGRRSAHTGCPATLTSRFPTARS